MINIGLMIAAFFFMELVAFTNHKYIMHGFLWRWHKDHHVNDHKKQTLEDEYLKGWEKNDLFFLVYGVPSAVLMFIAIHTSNMPVLFISIGMTIYGVTYFVVHDLVIHHRLKTPLYYFTKSRYLRAVVRAHAAHHRGGSKKDFSNYGLLIFQFRFFKENK